MSVMVIHSGKRNPAIVYNCGEEFLEVTKVEKDVVNTKTFSPVCISSQEGKPGSRTDQSPTGRSTPSQGMGR